MPEPEPEPDAAARERLIAVLAEHLCRPGGLSWPGADGLTTEEVVLAAWRERSADGQGPTLAELLAHFQSLAGGASRSAD